MQLGPMQKKWVEALRSGEYRQGVLSLFDEETQSYCCLGVAKTACELKEGSSIFLLDSYRDIGLRSETGKFAATMCFDDRFYPSLIAMNDSRRMTFQDIANFIEANPEIVFTRSV